MKTTLISLFLVSFLSGLPDIINNTIGPDHHKISTFPVYAETGNDFRPSVNADGCESADSLYFVVTKLDLDLHQAIAYLAEYLKVYNSPSIVDSKKMTISQMNGYIQEIALPKYHHSVFHILASDGKATYLIKAGSPESKRSQLLKLIKTLVVVL